MARPMTRLRQSSFLRATMESGGRRGPCNDRSLPQTRFSLGAAAAQFCRFPISGQRETLTDPIFHSHSFVSVGRRSLRFRYRFRPRPRLLSGSAVAVPSPRHARNGPQDRPWLLLPPTSKACHPLPGTPLRCWLRLFVVLRAGLGTGSGLVSAGLFCLADSGSTLLRNQRGKQAVDVVPVAFGNPSLDRADLSDHLVNNLGGMVRYLHRRAKVPQGCTSPASGNPLR